MRETRSEVLSRRTIQPGNSPRGEWTSVETGLTDAAVHYFTAYRGGRIIEESSEENKRFYLIEDSEYQWIVQEKPDTLRKFYSKKYSIVPELEILNVTLNRRMWLEAKFQGNLGNAEERAAKLFTMKFCDEIHKEYGFGYHPFGLIMGGGLANLERYKVKFQKHYYDYQYFLWTKHTTATTLTCEVPFTEEEILDEAAVYMDMLANTIIDNAAPFEDEEDEFFYEDDAELEELVAVAGGAEVIPLRIAA